MSVSQEAVFIIDDDEAMRDSLGEFFNAKGFRVATFESAEQFLAKANMKEAACAVIDLNLPGLSGLELQSELMRRGITIPVIILTGQGDIPKAVAAVKAGAINFFEKPFEPVALLKTVRDALDHEGQLRRSTAEFEEIGKRLSLLSTRENEVLELISLGHPSKIIAQKLDISVRTVEVHRSNIMGKMRCTNSTALVAMVLKANGILR